MVTDNTFADVIISSFVTACGITGDLQLSRNLFDFPLSKFTDMLSLYKDTGVSEIPVVFNGLGMVILSTPKGVLSDFEAKNANVGGELLLKIF